MKGFFYRQGFTLVEMLVSIVLSSIIFISSYQVISNLIQYQVRSRVHNEIKLDKSGIETPSFIDKSAVYGDDVYIGAFAYLSKNVVIGNNVKIYPNVFIGDNVKIGDNTTLFSGAKVYSESEIGKDCTIHSGVIIGSDGFGFVPNEKGEYNKVPQIGNVIIEDHVDIGSGTTIDRATLGSTFIRKGVKLDNQIQIAHNVEVDQNTVIASQTGIAGSTKIGKNCQIGGQVGIVGHIIIGNNVRIQAQSGIARSIKDNEVVQGSPALPYSDYNKSYVYFKNLPSLAKRIDALEKMNTTKEE